MSSRHVVVLVGEEARGITGHRVNTYSGHAKYTVYVVYSLWSVVYIRTVLPLAYTVCLANCIWQLGGNSNIHFMWYAVYGPYCISGLSSHWGKKEPREGQAVYREWCLAFTRGLACPHERKREPGEGQRSPRGRCGKPEGRALKKGEPENPVGARRTPDRPGTQRTNSLGLGRNKGISGYPTGNPEAREIPERPGRETPVFCFDLCNLRSIPKGTCCRSD